MLDKSKVVYWLQANALGYSRGECARYVRLALEAGGLDVTGHPIDGSDYGPFLLSKGAVQVPEVGYEPQNADIAVFAKDSFHKYGHICCYCAGTWISDFKQHHMDPYRQQDTAGAVSLYRFPENGRCLTE